MTAHDRNLPTTSTDPTTPQNGVVTRVRRDDDRSPAAVIVWRTISDDTDTTANPAVGDSALTPRLAHHLVAIYSDVHATIVDLDADDTWRHATEAAGRRYLTVTDLADLPTPPESEAAALIVLRWPRPSGTPGQHPDSLLRACQQHLAADGSAVVAVTAAVAGQPGARYAEHEQVLLPAAQAAGLRHLHDIVALPAADGRDTFTYTTASGATACDPDRHADAERPATRTTLVIFGDSGRHP